MPSSSLLSSIVLFLRVRYSLFFSLSLKGAAHKGFSAMLTADIHGDLVCGGGSDGSCTIWSVKTSREKARLTGHQQKVCDADDHVMANSGMRFAY